MSSSSSIITEEGDSVPEPLSGFKRFCHTDEELVSFYLEKMIQGRDHRFRHLIPEIDLCKHGPCDLPDTEEFLAYEELENALFGSDNHDNSQAGGGPPSDFDDQAVDDMIEELQQFVEDLDSPFPPPEPLHVGNFPDAYNDECSNWQCPSGENVSYLANKNNISTNYGKEPVNNIAYGAPHETISEQGQNLESLFDQLQPEDYTLESPFLNSELLGNFSHANNYIGCNGSEFLHAEIPAFFPQRS